jgi:hypothetical protein
MYEALKLAVYAAARRGDNERERRGLVGPAALN